VVAAHLSGNRLLTANDIYRRTEGRWRCTVIEARARISDMHARLKREGVLFAVPDAVLGITRYGLLSRMNEYVDDSADDIVSAASSSGC
jgi:hypothetical protein